VRAQAGAVPDAETPLRIEISPSGSCADADGFFSALLARAPSVRRAKPDEDTAQLLVELESGTSGRGRLLLLEGRGHTTERVVLASSCEEAVAALVLVAAVLLDPAAAAEREPVQHHPPPAPPPPRSRARPIALSRYRLGFATGVGLQGGVAPSLRPAEWLELSLARNEGDTPRERFAFSAWHTGSTHADVPAGRAVLSWSALRLAGCPFAFGSNLTLRPCAGFAAGVIDASGERTQEQHSYRAPWLAIDASARVELAVLGPLLLLAEGGLSVPLTRSHFYFAPQARENTAFRVPALSGFAALGLGARF
jgi:hypothetical protein